MFAIAKYFEIFWNVLALHNTAAVRLKFPFEYRCTDGWDFKVVLCLSKHINCTINWEPWNIMLVTDAGRQQVKHLFKRTAKDDQYTIKAAFDREETLVLSWLLEYSACIFSFFSGFLSRSVSKFSSPSILGCLMLHCKCSMFHCITSHVLVGSSSV